MTIYELNTAVWLAGRRLDEVPAADWDALAALPVDAVWLMGVWERSPAGLAIARASFTFPGASDDDIIGSPYCVRDYVVETQRRYREMEPERLKRLEGLRGLAEAVR